ncbi:uncharacterized protein LOC142783728 [Rhipicephalus microplus]|uniref:uncharacterized protein LOC119168187 n=1 Tax=Rhipicephalus microplus TaxID=6941 RepID=UPI003F6D2CD2
MEREEYVSMMCSTNPEQYELLREILHRQTTPGWPPLQVSFTGPTGCGKTFVLKLAIDVYNRCADCCGAVGWKYGSSSVPSVYNSVKCVIINEVSMMSADQLKLVDCRLRQITQRLTEPFSRLDVILGRDLRQLPPVRAREISKRPRRGDGLLGLSTATWHHLEYFPLARVMRQSDVTFSAVLTKIGDGRVLEPEEVKLLRFVTAEEAAERAPSAVRIFDSNAHVTNFNETMAHSQDDFMVPRTRDRYLGSIMPHLLENAKRRVARMVPSEFANLPGEVMAVVGKPYMITHKIDLVDGLVNGAVPVLHLCELAGLLPDDRDGVDEE